MSGWSLAAWVLAAVGRPVAGLAVGVGSAAALVRKLPDVPPRAAFRLAARGNAEAGEQIATAVRRAWWPVLAVVALRSRAARRSASQSPPRRRIQGQAVTICVAVQAPAGGAGGRWTSPESRP